MMSKEAAWKKKTSEPAPPTRSEKFRASMKTPEGRKVVRGLKGRGKEVLTGAALYKLMTPGSSMEEAGKSGLALHAGGSLGEALARRLGARGGKAQIAGHIAGSALGLRYLRNREKAKKKGKTDRELLEMALKKEGQAQLVSTATQPKTPSTPGVGQRWGQVKSLASKAGQGIKSMMETGANKQREQQQRVQSLQQFSQRRQQVAEPKPARGLDFSKYPSLNKSKPAGTQSTGSSVKPMRKSKGIQQALTRQGTRYQQFM